MSLNKLSRFLHLTNRTVRDVNAVKRGRIGRRIGNRFLGRFTSRLMRRAWFR
ncbi:hypothetical protein [Georgenia sp. Z1491]|uniref:hypothetical protein n=1 Tax=Georgenia sp. Z1491 TaxID=3416707 RepID=UPI003CF6BFBE